ncbi:MAG TPA: HlyD family efflux transporter periplasmic adaptor subunit [Patescibacteria group bacterium]|nr:HlyD family efflux transporter periplasmic adaptor subunit [Patescibacteria group bacterium]
MKKLFASIRNPKVIRALIIIVVVLLSVGAYLYYQSTQGRVFIDNSLVDAPIVSIAPSTSGKLTETDVYEDEAVKKGDAIAVVGGQTLYTDADGLIIMANDQIGSLAGPQSPVAQLIDPVDLRIAGTIDENKGLDAIRVGQVASFTVDALPGQTFWGYVDEISPSAKTTQLSFSISSERPTQQFVVYVKYDSRKYPQIKNGMSAKLTIYTNTH